MRFRVRASLIGLLVAACIAVAGTVGAVTASAHTGQIAISCAKVSFSFASFPTHGKNQVNLHVSVDGHSSSSQESFYGSSYSTDIQLNLANTGNHTVTASADWRVDGGGNAGPVTQQISCGSPPCGHNGSGSYGSGGSGNNCTPPPCKHDCTPPPVTPPTPPVVPTPPTPPADLGVQKMVDNPTPSIGDMVTYTIITTNHGPGTAVNAQISDPIPAGLELLSLNALDDPVHCTITGGVGAQMVMCSYGDMANGQVMTLHVTARVDQAGTWPNTVCESEDVADQNQQANGCSTATITVNTPPAATPPAATPPAPKPAPAPKPPHKAKPPVKHHKPAPKPKHHPKHKKAVAPPTTL